MTRKEFFRKLIPAGIMIPVFSIIARPGMKGHLLYNTPEKENKKELFEATYTYGPNNCREDFCRGESYRYDDTLKKEFQFYVNKTDKLTFNKPVKILKLDPRKDYNIVFITTLV